MIMYDNADDAVDDENENEKAYGIVWVPWTNQYRWDTHRSIFVVLEGHDMDR